LKYEESGKSAKDETSGSISFSKVTIQPSKASLKNNITKDVEFANKATRTEIVFDGTYTAKKGDIELNEFKLVQTRTGAYQQTNKVTFYVYVDDMKTAVADADAKFANGQYLATNTFNNIRVKAGESVNVRVEAEVEAENTAENFSSYTLGKYKLYIW
jgi:LysM repeat protein